MSGSYASNRIWRDAREQGKVIDWEEAQSIFHLSFVIDHLSLKHLDTFYFLFAICDLVFPIVTERPG